MIQIVDVYNTDRCFRLNY